MYNFKNTILLVVFNYSNCICNKNIIKEIYEKHFKKIIFYSDYPIIQDDEVNFIEIDKGYYSFSLDEDHPTYDEKYTEYVEKTLEPGMEPIIIYEYDQFVTKKLENKYRSHIEQELERYNNSRSLVQRKEWKDIREIVKREVRYERE